MESIFSGTAGMWSLITLIGGFVMLGVEMCIPGFGLPGTIGIIALISSCVLQFMTQSVGLALGFTACVLVLAAALMLIFLRSFRKGALSRSALVNRAASGSGEEEAKQDELIGQRGVTVTPLRPGGIAEINGKRLSVETDGNFLEKGVPVEIVMRKGPGIIVHEVL